MQKKQYKRVCVSTKSVRVRQKVFVFAKKCSCSYLPKCYKVCLSRTGSDSSSEGCSERVLELTQNMLSI